MVPGLAELGIGEGIHQPMRLWRVVTAIGVGTTVLMVLYNKLVMPRKSEVAG